VHGYTGFLSNVGDVDDMASHAINLLKDENKLATFKQNALAHARLFDLQTILPFYEKYYQKIIDQSKL